MGIEREVRMRSILHHCSRTYYSTYILSPPSSPLYSPNVLSLLDCLCAKIQLVCFICFIYMPLLACRLHGQREETYVWGIYISVNQEARIKVDLSKKCWAADPTSIFLGVVVRSFLCKVTVHSPAKTHSPLKGGWMVDNKKTLKRDTL